MNPFPETKQKTFSNSFRVMNPFCNKLKCVHTHVCVCVCESVTVFAMGTKWILTKWSSDKNATSNAENGSGPILCIWCCILISSVNTITCSHESHSWRQTGTHMQTLCVNTPLLIKSLQGVQIDYPWIGLNPVDVYSISKRLGRVVPPPPLHVHVLIMHQKHWPPLLGQVHEQ